MQGYIIEDGGEIKETFHYERPLNADSLHALLEYACANYGAEAVFRMMTAKEEADFSKGDDD